MIINIPHLLDVTCRAAMACPGHTTILVSLKELQYHKRHMATQLLCCAGWNYDPAQDYQDIMGRYRIILTRRHE